MDSYILIPRSAALSNSFSDIFKTGMIFYAGLIFLLGGLIIYRAHFAWKNSLGMMLILVVALMIPLSAVQLYQTTSLSTQAESSVMVVGLKVEQTEGEKVRLSFTTTEPVMAYVEYKATNSTSYVPVLPVDVLRKKRDHVVVIPKVGPSGGMVVFVINGEKFFLNGKPLKI